MRSKHLLPPMIGALSFCLAGPGQAQEQEQEQREVFYSDLNLASEAGRHRLDRRIHRAVKIVCGAESGTRETLKATILTKSCVKDSLARAMAAKAEVLAAMEKNDGSRVAALTVRRDQ